MAWRADARKREVNFFEALRQYESVKEKTGRSSKLGITLIVAAAFLAIAGFGLRLTSQIRLADEEIEAMQSYLEDTQVQAAYAERSKQSGDLTKLLDYNKACEAYIEQLRNIPRVESKNFDQVAAQLPLQVQINAYDFTDPVLTVHCDTPDKNAPALFAENLTKANLFADVFYDGFAEDGQSTGRYTFSIQLTLW